jgi:DNA polymerase-3 subunit chi
MTETACEVWFYHLERTSLDQILPDLLEKTLARGWKALIRSNSADRIEQLDGLLWSYRDDSFLPHGVSPEPSAQRQPILLTMDMTNVNGADALFLLDGAEPGDLSHHTRCILIFDGRDPEALATARVRWSQLRSSGCPVAYWRQGETRGWERQA